MLSIIIHYLLQFNVFISILLFWPVQLNNKNYLEEGIERIFQKEKLVSKFTNLSSITIKHPEIIVDTPGVYHTILKLFAWEGINLIELASTYTELTLVFKGVDINRAFSTLTNFFKAEKNKELL